MDDTRPLVSIIIPVYKVEKYLEQCVASARNQTYTNLEIILVDDGSPDRCGQMCDAYAAEDPRIKVIHQQNSGVAEARNAGLACASGEYFFFADSDDVISIYAIDVMVAAAVEHGADMVCSVHESVEEDAADLDRRSAPSDMPLLIMDRQEALHYYTPAEWGPWNRLVSANVHKGIFFPNYRIHEDEAIKFLLLERCKRVVEIHTPTYFYRQRTTSITGESSGVDRMDMFYSRNQNLAYLKQNHPDLAPLFLPKVCEDALLNIGTLIRQHHTSADSRLAMLTAFFREHTWEILGCQYVSCAQKLRCVLIVCSNWKKANCLYVRFYLLLGKLRGKC